LQAAEKDRVGSGTAAAADLKLPPFNGPAPGVQPPATSNLLNFKEDDLLF
jgi:hypothetical protein